MRCDFQLHPTKPGRVKCSRCPREMIRQPIPLTAHVALDCPGGGPVADPSPKAPRPLRSLPVPCTLRGDQIGTLEATRCGMVGEVYPVHACPVHGSCVLYTICRRQEVQACQACEERKAPPEFAAPPEGAAR